MGYTAPKTWVTGEPATAADMTAYVGADAQYLNGDPTSYLIPLAAGNPGFFGWPQSGAYAPFGGGYARPSVERHGPIVTLSGLYTCTKTGNPLDTITVVNPIYRPAHSQGLTAQINNTVTSRAQLRTTGEIIVAPALILGDSFTVTGSYSVLT